MPAGGTAGSLACLRGGHADSGDACLLADAGHGDRVRPGRCGDRITGMAASQAELVHRGIAYDMQVDTTHTEALECARAIAARVR